MKGVLVRRGRPGILTGGGAGGRGRKEREEKSTCTQVSRKGLVARVRRGGVELLGASDSGERQTVVLGRGLSMRMSTSGDRWVNEPMPRVKEDRAHDRILSEDTTSVAVLDHFRFFFDELGGGYVEM